MTMLEDFLSVNKQAFKRTIGSFSKNYLIFLIGIIYSFIVTIGAIAVSFIFRGPLYILSGFVTGFITASLMSNYLYLLFIIINYDRKITFEDFKRGFTAFLGQAYSVLILIWIVNYFLGVFGLVSPKGAISISSLVNLSIFTLFNALPETIYLKQYTGIDSFIYSLEFLKDNLINWGIPMVIFNLVIYIISGSFVRSFLPSLNVLFYYGLYYTLRQVLGQVVFSFMMIYRGYLYRTLSTSTKRKREFMNNF